MRLLNTNTCRLRDPVYDSIPDYAILSHRWGAAKDEVTFEEIEQADHKDFEARPGYRKIQNCCAQAKSVGLENVWVDTCCIKKSSTAELTAALNSMFHWYRNAQVCYCYLADVPSNENPSIANSSFRRSNWFKRGWTLQELLAPLHVVFFAEDWKVLGTKASLQSVISEITGLSSQILLMNHGGEISVAERMSWAANRETAQVEDKAYCLMGLFGVSMPMMYGEGEKAFERLQLEIMKVSDDQSLFAWVRNDSLNRKTGLLARSPSEFRDSANISMRNGQLWNSPYAMTNKGLNITLPLIPQKEASDLFIGVLGCHDRVEGRPLGIYLQKLTNGDGFTSYVRVRLDRIHTIANDGLPEKGVEIYVKHPDRANFNVLDWMRPENEYIFSIRKSPEGTPTISSNVHARWSMNENNIYLRFWRSGHSGVMLFKNPNGQILSIFLGLHNYNIWCDMEFKDTEEDIMTIANEYWHSSSRNRWRNYDRKTIALPDNKSASIEVWKGQLEGQRAYYVDVNVESGFLLHALGPGCCFE